MGKKTRGMKRLAGALAFFLIGGATAATFSGTRQQHQSAIAKPAKAPVVAADRIALSPDSARKAIAAGLIDRPVKSVLNVPARMQYGDFRWDDKGVPTGPIWIRVDLGAQLISVFRSGDEIGTAVILYGADSVPTPVGKFPILAKFKDHQSATYDAAMPYTLRLTTDGVSIHASDVRWGYATHGCISVPAEFAAKLFGVASVGDEVMIVRGRASDRA
jgi:lipoprotein-anchoring transpeptidase ErfK/SrfK